MRLDDVDVGLLKAQLAMTNLLPFGLDHPGELLRHGFLDPHLDARTMDVVAAGETVVDAQDRFEIQKQTKFRPDIADLVSKQRQAAQATAAVQRMTQRSTKRWRGKEGG